MAHSEIYDFKFKTIAGQETSLAPYRDKVLLIVNTASECGFTPQYKGLEELYRKHKDKGFEIIGFPCNQFGGQEPGSEEEIKSFCEVRFGVTFPLMGKVDVNGKNAHPLYEYLKSHQKGVLGTEAIKWNFTKFLVAPGGEVLKRYAPSTKPEDLESELVTLLPR